MINKKHRKTTMSLHKTTIFLKCKKQRKGRQRETERQIRQRDRQDRETGRQAGFFKIVNIWLSNVVQNILKKLISLVCGNQKSTFTEIAK